MANFVDQEILMNSVLGKISDTILNGDGDLVCILKIRSH